MLRKIPTQEYVGIIDFEQITARQSEALAHFQRSQKLRAGSKLIAQNYAFNVKSSDDKITTFHFTLNTDIIFQGSFDPTSTDPEHQHTRQSLFQQVTSTRALPSGMQCINRDGVWHLFQLMYGIYPRTQAPGYYIINDAADSVLGKGISGNVCDVIGKWQPTIDTPQQLSFTPSFDKRVIKIFHPLKKGVRFNVGKEQSLMQRIPYFKVREVMMHEVGDSSTQYISQKKIRGANFRDLLDTRSSIAPRTATQKLTIAILLLRAVWRDMHLRQILHRDIKPPNIIVDCHETQEYWSVKLVDLGCARNISETKISFVGTPIYNAPEICSKQEYSTKSDLYAAIRVIGELFGDEEIETYRTPQPNFEKTRANEELIRFKLKITRPSDLSTDQDEKLIKILVKSAYGKPSERYNDEEAIAALEAFQLEVVISRTHESLHAEIKSTHAAATTLAKTLDIKSIAHCTKARPLIELQTDILQALEKIGGSVQALSFFKSILAIKCLVNCESKEDTRNKVTSIISNYEKNYVELTEAIRNLEAVFSRLKKQDVPEQAMKIERDLIKAKRKLSTHANYQFDLDEIDEANLSIRQSIIKVNALTRYCEGSPALELISNSPHTRLLV